jgi:hypothetical protein
MGSHNESCTDAQFIALWRDLQSGAKVARHLGITERGAHLRRRNIEKKHDIVLPIFDPHKPQYNTHVTENKAVAAFKITDGCILVGSDAHIWPGPLTAAQRAFLRFAKELKPKAIIANGDFFDGAQISRHPSIGWESRPTVKRELEAVQDYLGELIKACPTAKRFWPLGNHDMRFESRIANSLPEMAKVDGVHLKDHFPQWIPCWRVDVNDDVVVKHRWHNGLHATHNNTLKSGKSIVTGHLHSLQVRPWTDYTGTRFGVDTGTMADPGSDQFVNYTEAGPVNWRSGFVVLTFKGGRMLWPEVVAKHDDDHVEFRGQVVKV